MHTYTLCTALHDAQPCTTCMHTHMHTHTHTCTQTHTYIHSHTNTHTHTHTNTHTQTHTHTHTHTSLLQSEPVCTLGDNKRCNEASLMTRAHLGLLEQMISVTSFLFNLHVFPFLVTVYFWLFLCTPVYSCVLLFIPVYSCLFLHTPVYSSLPTSSLPLSLLLLFISMMAFPVSLLCLI